MFFYIFLMPEDEADQLSRISHLDLVIVLRSVSRIIYDLLKSDYFKACEGRNKNQEIGEN